MKIPYLPSLFLLCALSPGAQAGNILIQNFLEDGTNVSPVTFADGSLPALGSGIAVVGGFRDEAAVIGVPATRSAWASLVEGFLPFGSSAASLGDANAYSIPGLYAMDQSRPMKLDDPLVGKTMFTVIGNASTLAESTSVLLLQHAEWFAADRPIFGAMLLPHEPGVELLLGNLGGPVTLPGLGDVPHSLQFASLFDDLDFPVDAVPPIPEPSTTVLLLLGGGWLVRRRRTICEGR